MWGESKGHHGGRHWGHHHRGRCACGCESGLGAAFWSEKEKIAWLEESLEGLQEQVKAVQDRISALKGQK